MPGRTSSAPEMANLCAPFPVTGPPCPCRRPLPAASWTTARWQHIQASQSVGSGEREGGRRRRRRLGKGGDPGGLSREGGGTVPSRAPRLVPGKHTSQARKQLSLTLAGLKPGHPAGTAGRGRDLAFSPSHAGSLLSSLSGSPLPSPLRSSLPLIGVYLQSLRGARGPRLEDC